MVYDRSQQNVYSGNFIDLADAADTGFILLDRDLKIRYLNPAFKTMLGVEAAGALDHPLEILDAHSDQLIEVALRALR